MKKSASLQPKGLLIVLSSPSGGGKTTVALRVLKKDKNIVRSVSCTTRKPRPGEKNGKDYFFITPSRFKSMVSGKKFLEWAEVHGRFYGTPRRWVEEQLRKGRDVLFVIDVQGGKALRRKSKRGVLIFLKPPSFTVLKRRLLGRRTETREAVQTRLENARWEMAQGRHYGYRVVNDRLSLAVSQVLGIIRAERGKNQEEKGKTL